MKRFTTRKFKCGTKLIVYRCLKGWRVEAAEFNSNVSSVWGPSKGQLGRAGVGIADESLSKLIRLLQKMEAQVALERSHLKEPKDGPSKG